jgi:hypothetical protein
MKIRLDRSRAEYLATALAHGRPIEPDSDAGWTANDALVLVGAGVYAALCYGPNAYRGASGQAFNADLYAAVAGVADALTKSVEGKDDDRPERPYASQGVVRVWPAKTRPLPWPLNGPPTPGAWP